MEIKTITCHDCYNYGASLQAFALQQFLVQSGHNCEIINYRPSYLSSKYQFLKVQPNNGWYKIYKYSFIFKPIIALYANRPFLKFYKRKKAFDEFTSSKLLLTPVKYESAQQLTNEPPTADVFIAGSDQIWNTDMNNGRDPVFYLSFVKSGRKISYAASFGISQVNVEYADYVKQHLKQLDWISVRENTGVKIAEDLGVKATQVLDPVFLLPQRTWSDIATSNKIRDRYLLLYYLGKKSEVTETIAIRIAKEKGLKIVSVNDMKQVSFADLNINDAGPLEFLSLVKNAEFVVSTSFHATAFSIIFNKQFCVCPISGQRNHSRMKDLLGLFSLDNQFVTDADQHVDHIDYIEKYVKIEELTDRSRNLLIKNLNYA